MSAVLGVASHDVVTLGTHERNNKFSKRKPVRGESPSDYATWDKNTGNVRAAVGYPIVWGMEIPFNTWQQLGTSGTTAGHRRLKPLAWRAAHRYNATSEGNVRNYVYKRPVVGTDFVRLGDYNGYWHNAADPWSVGVAGAEDQHSTSAYDGSTGCSLAVDTFDTATLRFFIGTPDNADIKFADLFGEQGYRFFIELYLNDSSVSSDSDVPNAVIVSTKDLSALGWGASYEIPVSTIASKCGITWGTGIQKIIAVLGVNKFGDVPPLTEEKSQSGSGLGYAWLASTYYNTIAEGVGSIPPWSKQHKPFICDIEFRSYSKVTIAPSQYANPVSGSYTTNMPTSNIAWHSDGIRLKTTVSNKGTSAFTLNDTPKKNKFQIQAQGQFDTSDPSVAAMCLTPFEGKWKDVEIGTDPVFGSGFSTNPITIAAGASNGNIYMRCLGFMPKGTVTAFGMRVSTDGGQTWVITAHFSGAFVVS